jgi:photosystem II stability/assembly factor-like uncharacterized protein
VYKSATGGNIWIPASTGLTSLEILALAVDPQDAGVVYAGSNGFGAQVFKSTDGGAHWNSSLTDGAIVAKLIIDPENPNTVYAGDLIKGIFKSADGGVHWTLKNSGLPSPNINALVIDPRAPATLYVSIDSGLFKTTSGAESWSPIGTGLPCCFGPAVLAIDPQVPTTLYAGEVFDGVFKSTDGGVSWRPINTGLPSDRDTAVNTLAVDPKASNVLYVAIGGAGIFKSTNGGVTWSPRNSGLAFTRVGRLVVDPHDSSTVYAATAGAGVFKSTDGGATWRSSNAALNNPNVTALALDPTTPTLLYAGGDGGAVKSTGGGASWGQTQPGINFNVSALVIDSKTPTTVYAATGFFLSGLGVFKTTDGGASWVSSSSGLPQFARIDDLAGDPVTPTTLYAAIPGAPFGGVFKSTDGGASWTLRNTGLGSAFSDVRRVAIDPKTPSTVYLGTFSNGVFKSTDGGASWAPRNAFLTGTINALAIDPQTPAILYAGTNQGLFKSTNGGVSWSRSNAGLLASSIAALAIVPQTPATVYAGTDQGVFRSTDGGASWTPHNAGLGTRSVSSLVVSPSGSCLHAGTEIGVFDFATQVDATCFPPPTLAAAISPTSQSVQVGTPAQTLATVRNIQSGAPDVTGPHAADTGATGVTCGITQLTGAPTPFAFQAVDSTTNQPIAPPNTPVDIAAGDSQTFLVTLKPLIPICALDIQFGYNCTNSGLAPIITGINTLLLTATTDGLCGMTASVSVNQSSFAVGQTLVVAGSVTNPGLQGAADFYVGILRPDNSIQFFTSAGLVVGYVADLASFRPLAVNVPLTAPFSRSAPTFYTYSWRADDPRGSYVMFLVAVKAGALAGGTIANDQILGIARAPYSFP